jgi:hypothetical protein
VAFYLAALLLERKTEVPVQLHSSYVFASYATFAVLPDGDFKTLTTAFFAVKNVMAVLVGRVSLFDLLSSQGSPVVRYGRELLERAATDSTLNDQLTRAEVESRKLAGPTGHDAFTHTVELMSDLAQSGSWQSLAELARRHIDPDRPGFPAAATRMLALALSHSTAPEDKNDAARLYAALTSAGASEPTDAHNLAALLIELNRPDEAKDVVNDGIARYPDMSSAFLDLGHRIVEATGDKNFRDRLRSTVKATK